MGVDTLINLKFLTHPLNWAIVFLMLLIASIAGHELLSLVGQEPAS